MNKALKCLIVLMTILSITLAGCQKQQDQAKMEINLYFVNQEGTKLVAEPREIPVVEEGKAVEAVLNELLKGPAKPENKRVIPEGTTVKKITMDGGLVIVDFSSQFLNDTEADRIFSRLSVVSALTDLEGVERVSIKVEGEDLTTESGKVIGVLSKQDIVYDTEPSGSDKQYIKLYFADENAEKLVAEAREITVNPKETMEMRIVKELINGPNSSQLLRTIPSETKILSVETKEGVCFVNLSQEFKTKHSGGTSAELMTIYSIVNSLTELNTVDKVQFLIEGQKSEVFIHMVFNEPFTRDESLIQ